MTGSAREGSAPRRPRDLSPFVQGFSAKTPTLLPATHTESYALGSREVLLVEPATPYEDEQRAWMAWARGLSSAGRTATAIFLTHHHADHVGGAAVFARELGLPLWAHEETAKRIGVPVARHLTEGESVTLEGSRPSEWTVLHTPGHAPGHLCLFEKDSGTLVVGDMVASEGTILIEPGDGHMATYLQQLARLEALGATLALPAHGAPIEDPGATFRHYIEHRGLREQKTLSAVRTSPTGTLGDLLRVVYQELPESLFPIAALSLRCHLDKLEEEGRVRVDDEGCYRVAGAGGAA